METETMIGKIIVIAGDCSLIGLGISDEDRKLIAENVTLIYHFAATIRFDEKLKRAVELNTRGTQEMIKLALECNKLDVRFFFFFAILLTFSSFKVFKKMKAVKASLNFLSIS